MSLPNFVVARDGRCEARRPRTRGPRALARSRYSLRGKGLAALLESLREKVPVERSEVGHRGPLPQRTDDASGESFWLGRSEVDIWPRESPEFGKVRGDDRLASSRVLEDLDWTGGVEV